MAIAENKGLIHSITGSSLVEIVVALGLLSFLCLAVGEVTNKSMIAQRTVNAASTFDEILGAASLLLLSDPTCSKALVGQTFDPTNAAGSAVTINLTNGNPLIPASMITPDNAIKFTSILLMPASSLPTQTVVLSTVSTAMTVTFANLTMVGERLGSKLGSPTITGTVTNIPVATSPDNIIRYCAGITNSSAYDICTAQSASPNTPGVCPMGAFLAPTITCLAGTVCP